MCDALSDLVPHVQFKKREKRELTLLHVCFSRFLNCMNGTKSRKAPHIQHEKRFIQNINLFGRTTLKF